MRPSGRETSKASRGSSIPQKIIDVVVPVGVSNEICEATYASGLEEAFSVPLLEGDGETRVPGIQQADFAPRPPAGGGGFQNRILLKKSMFFSSVFKSLVF